MNNNEPGVWVIGDGNIGFPSYQKNKSNWGPKEGNAIPFCPMGENIYELVLKAGTNINPGSINWKLFYQMVGDQNSFMATMPIVKACSHSLW